MISTGKLRYRQYSRAKSFTGMLEFIQERKLQYYSMTGWNDNY